MPLAQTLRFIILHIFHFPPFFSDKQQQFSNTWHYLHEVNLILKTVRWGIENEIKTKDGATVNLHCPIEMRLFKYLQEINRENVFKMGGKVEHLKNRKQGLKPDPSRASCLNVYLQ